MSKTRGYWHSKMRWVRVTRIMARDGDACTICGQLLDRHLRSSAHPRYITFDHIVPRSDGGRDDLANLRLAHQRCNNERGNDPVLPADESAAEP